MSGDEKIELTKNTACQLIARVASLQSKVNEMSKLLEDLIGDIYQRCQDSEEILELVQSMAWKLDLMQKS